MRAFTAAALALATATGAAANKFVSTIDGWEDPVVKPIPTYNNGYKWSYYPNSGGILSAGQCGSAAGQEACGPLNWGVYKSNCLNTAGNQQTPIDLDINEAGYSKLSKSAGAFKFRGYKCAGAVEPKNGTWEVDFWDCPKQSSLMYNGQKYNFWQMHVHSISEHSVNAGYYPVEVHLVHFPDGASPRESNLAPDHALVIGVFLTVGKPNSLMSVFTQHSADEEGPIAKPVNPYMMLPKGDKSYWHYKGSLTTPFGIYGTNIGCNLPNGVEWFVMKKANTISAAQYAWLTSHLNTLPLPYLGLNNRPIQEILDETTIYSYGKPLN